MSEHVSITTEFPEEILEQWADGESAPDVLFTAGALGKRMGVEIVKASPDEVVGVMPVEGNTQPYGLLHGGASVVLAETLGSVGSMLHAGPGKIAVGVDINATHHRSTTAGLVTGTARPLHRGRSTATYEVVITDDRARRLCTARITCLLRDA